MTTTGLASIEKKPQDQQQLHDGKNGWSNKKKLYMNLQVGLNLYVEVIYILDIIYSLTALYVFALLPSIGQLL